LTSTAGVPEQLVAVHLRPEYATEGSAAHRPTHPQRHAQLLMLDVHILPGMVGAPVVDAEGSTLLALVLPPLRHQSSGAQIALAVPLDAVVAALRGEPAVHTRVLGEALPRRDASSWAGGRFSPREEGLRLPSQCGASATSLQGNKTAVERAAASVVMVDTGHSWGSGVCISTTGVVLTNVRSALPALGAAGEGFF
jgi:hypothetical protein